MAPKRKQVGSDEPANSKNAKSKTSASPDGWTKHPPSMMYNCQNIPESEKIAGFDLDGTLVNLKTGAEFGPVFAEDWQFYTANVPKTVQGFHKDGYKIVIFADYGTIKTALDGKAAVKMKARTDAIVKALGVPVAVYIATQAGGSFYKPKPDMWDFMCSQQTTAKVDKARSFFVGDAAGRPSDSDAVDKEFAANIGLEFKTPEQVFGERAFPCAASQPGPQRVIAAPPLESLETRATCASATAPQAGISDSGSGVAVRSDKDENAALCACFDELAVLMKNRGDRFKQRAFKKVSATLATQASKITSGKQAREFQGIGKASADLIDEWLATGKMKQLEDLRAESQAPKDSQNAGSGHGAGTASEHDTGSTSGSDSGRGAESGHETGSGSAPGSEDVE